MFILDRDLPLTEEVILKILSDFISKDKPRIDRYYNYYQGKQDILKKKFVDPCKPCNKIVTNYCEDIANTYLGYLLGESITYSGDGIDNVLDVLNYNDVDSEDTELLKWALITGIGFEIHYLDEEGKERFKAIDPRQCIPVYNADLSQELRAVIRFYKVDNPGSNKDKYYVEVYENDMTSKYISDERFNSIIKIDEEPNFYNQVPVVVFELNEERKSIFDGVMGLNDAYNTLVSSSTDDFEAFCDAYLVLENMDVDEDVLATMKENRILIMPSGGKASYLTKSVTEQQVMELLELINKNIHKIAACPDFSNESFGTQSGIAMKMKLLGMENKAQAIENTMRKALQKRFELITSILSLSEGDEVWRDVIITFNRNIPEDESVRAQELVQLKGLVDTKTLLSRLPWIKDVDSVYEALLEEKKNNESLFTSNFMDDVNE